MASSGQETAPQLPDGGKLALHILTPKTDGAEGELKWRALPLPDPSRVPVQLCSMEDCVLLRDARGRVIKFEGEKQTVMNFKTPVEDIAAGPRHALFLMKHGEVFCYGDNSFGQCGRDPFERNVEFPQPPTQIPLRHRVKQIAAGVDKSAVVLSNGDVVVWGGQSVDLYLVEDSIVTYKSEDFNWEQLKQISLGLNHIAFLDYSGQLWHAGDFGDIGRRAGVDKHPNPVTVEGNLGGLVVRKVVCGPDFTLALTGGGKLFRYGRIPAKFTNLSSSFSTRITEDASVDEDDAIAVVIPHSEAVRVHSADDRTKNMKWEDVYVSNMPREPFLDYASKRSNMFSNLGSQYPKVWQQLQKISSLGFVASAERSTIPWIRSAPLGLALGVNSLRHVFSLGDAVFDRPLQAGSGATVNGILKSYFVSHIAQSARSIYFVGSCTNSFSRKLAPVEQPASVSELAQVSRVVLKEVVDSLQKHVTKSQQRDVHFENEEFQSPQKAFKSPQRRKESTNNRVEENRNLFALLDSDETEETSPVEVDNVASDVQEAAVLSDAEHDESCGSEERSVLDEVLFTNSSYLFGTFVASIERRKLPEVLNSECIANTIKDSEKTLIEYLNERSEIGKKLSSAVLEKTWEDLLSLRHEGQLCKNIQQKLGEAQFCKEEKSCFLVMWEAFILRHTSDCLAAFAVFQNTVCVICEWLEYLQRKWDHVNTLPSVEPSISPEQVSSVLEQQRQQLSSRKKGVGRRDREASQRQRGSRRFGQDAPPDIGSEQRSTPSDSQTEQDHGNADEDHIAGIGYSGQKGDEIAGGGYVIPETDHASPAGHEAKLAHQAASAQAAANSLLGIGNAIEYGSVSPIQATAKRLLKVIRENPREANKHGNVNFEEDEYEQIAGAEEASSVGSSSGSVNVSVSKHSIQRRMNKAQYSGFGQLSPSKSSGDLRSDFGRVESLYNRGTVDDTHQPVSISDEAGTHLPSGRAVQFATEHISRPLRDKRFHGSGSATSEDAQSVIEKMRDALKTIEFFRGCQDDVLLCVASILMWAASSTWNLPVTGIDPNELRNSLSLNYNIWSDMLTFLKAYKPCFMCDDMPERKMPASHMELVHRFYRLPDYVKVPLFSLNKKEKDLQRSSSSKVEDEGYWQSFVVEPLRRISHGIFCPLTVEEVYNKGLKELELRKEECSMKELLGKLAEAIVSDADLYCASCLMDGRNWWENYMETHHAYTSHFDFNHLSKCVQSDYSAAHTGCSSSASLASADRTTDGSELDDECNDQSRENVAVSPEAVVAADTQLSVEEAKTKESEKNRIAKQKKNARKAEHRKRNAMRRKVISEFTSREDQGQRARVDTLKKVLDIVKGDSLLQTRSGQLLPVHGEIVKKRIPNIVSEVGTQPHLQWHRFPWLEPSTTEVLSFPWELRDVPDSLLPELLAYAYRGKPTITTTTALPLLVASAALELHDLRRAVEHFLLTNRFASAETVSQMIELSVQTKAYGLFSFARTLAVLDGVSIEQALQLERVSDSQGAQEPEYQTPRRSRTYSVGEVAGSDSHQNSPWEKDRRADSSRQTLAERLRSQANSPASSEH